MEKTTLFLEHYRRFRFIVLFFSLLVVIGLNPILVKLGRGFAQQFIEVFLALNLLAAVFTIVGKRMHLLVFGLIALFFAAKGLYAVVDFTPILHTGNALWIMLCLVSAIVILLHVMRVNTVNADIIFAALSVYLLFGFIFGFIYFRLEQIWPGSLVASASSFPPGARFGLVQTIYFSFVTLGTLGYGDIIPASDEVRSLAVMETMCGQVYLAVLVARLVSLYTASWRGAKKNIE